jgi:hypothetical protein
MGDIPKKIMQIGIRLLVKHEGTVQEGIVLKLFEETIEIKLLTGEIIIRKYWEVRSLKNEKE